MVIPLERQNKNMALMGVPPRFIDVEPEDIVAMHKNLGCYLYGTAGTGKTTMAVQYLRHKFFVECKGNMTKHMRFVKVPDLLMRLRATMNKDAVETEIDVVNRIRNLDFLILDDLGAEKASDWTIQSLYCIVDHRYDNLKPTIFTSNFHPTKLAEVLGTRLVSRILGFGPAILREGTDKRKAK